ncbi:MAG: hypothetical protein H7Y27_16680 [Gemmatimonadaceae bacterium]|nr:hypothetical protein [Chitinophagaceae bacterium]
MQKFLSLPFRHIAAFILLLSTAGCLKDKSTYTYQIVTPVYKTLTEVRADMKSGPVEELRTPGKIYVYGKYLFVNEINRGIHIIDNSSPSAPKKISFIKIPGNVDLAVKGNILYADTYRDLVAMDISDPKNVTAKKFLSNVFPYQGGYIMNTSGNPDSTLVLVDYTVKDTTVDANYRGRYYFDCPNCMYANAAQATASAGQGKAGSMSRFALVNDNLFTVSQTDLTVINTSTAADPTVVVTKKISNWGIETIFPLKDKLFIGSNSAMYIYDITNPSSPTQLSQFTHFRSCDPVVAEGNYAYVTLRDGNSCGTKINELQVVDITNLNAPALKKTYAQQNPRGLSKDGNTLIICDGPAGVKFFDATDVSNIVLRSTITGIDPNDVITIGPIAIVTANDGLYQFDFSDIGSVKQISRLSITRN